ncbi:hypothetical protein BGZ51_001191 [Haplosporangium sp. Z 767]|nr:hypothetical protein BGZ51_001191 [Haplosporangium sp. Z 767]
MPSVGLGTYRVRDQDTLDTCILEALRAGYRLIDTASVYKNEVAIGSSLKKILQQNLVPGLTREDVFLTSKLAVQESLRNLQVDYIDLYLIHWPGTAKLKLEDPQNAINRMESWRALEDLYHAKKLRAIGVSNFTLAHLNQLLERPHFTHPHRHPPLSPPPADGSLALTASSSDDAAAAATLAALANTSSSTATSAVSAGHPRTMVMPHVHQFEMHPRLFQKDLVEFCHHHRIQVQAYSSLGEGRLISLTPPLPPAMDTNYNTAPMPGALDIMLDLIHKYFGPQALDQNADEDTRNKEYARRSAQILLRWGLQHGAVVIPKSTHPERIRHNIDLFSFELDAADMNALDAYSVEGERTRYCWDPTEVC